MFLTPLRLEAIEARPDFWWHTAPLIWQEPGFRLVIPVGYITDLASTPRLLRGWFDVNGRSRRGAAGHDYLYHSHLLSRAHADDFLRRAIIAEGDKPWQARAYWLGVRLGGSSSYWMHAGLTAADFVTPDAYRAALAA